MKKLLFSIIIGMTAGLVMAQDVVMVEEPSSDVSVSADVSLLSAYVWRGQVLNDSMVAQPSVTVAYGPLWVNVWGNWDMGNANYNTTEIDYTAGYTVLDTDDVTMDVGIIFYTFPCGNDFKSTEEVFLTTTLNSIIFTPVASLYYDLDEANGFYGNLAISQPCEISDALTAEIGGSIGYGTRNYNTYMFGQDKNAVNDYNIYVSAEYALTEDLTLGALLQYTHLGDELDSNGAYEADEIVWGGISLSYTFL
ncbi:MAG: MipA/OmpV family protein [Kiritimatiellales bacterium]|nr:MipA/OmpV family protein [Kiritimatiellales bacterium]